MKNFDVNSLAPKIIAHWRLIFCTSLRTEVIYNGWNFRTATLVAEDCTSSIYSLALGLKWS